MAKLFCLLLREELVKEELSSQKSCISGELNFESARTMIARAFGTRNPRFNLTGDDFVGFEDFLLFAQAFGT